MRNLVSKAKRKDADAFAELVQLYMQDMYKVAIAILMNDDDAGDAIQETILKCWEKLPTLKNDMFFKTWMTRILINNCYDILNQRKRFTGLDEVEERGQCDKYNLELKEALSALDEKYRLVLILYYSQGYRTEEIARILGISASTIQTRLSRGREKLAEYFYDTSFDRRN